MVGLIFISLVFSANAAASKPKLGFVDSAVIKNKATVWFSVSNNVNGLRVVQCLGKRTKKPVGCKGRVVVKKPKKYYKGGKSFWTASFKAKKGINHGYVVASNSSGSTKKSWTTFNR